MKECQCSRLAKGKMHNHNLHKTSFKNLIKMEAQLLPLGVCNVMNVYLQNPLLVINTQNKEKHRWKFFPIQQHEEQNC